MNNFNINPYELNTYSNINATSTLNRCNQNTIERQIKNNKQKEFKKILDDCEKSYGNKFIAGDIEKAPKNTEEKQLLEAAMDLEALFVNQMFKSMRNTLNKESDMLYGGMTEDIFSDMLYNEYSTMTSKNTNLGLAKQIYMQLIDVVRNEVNNSSNIDEKV